MERNSHLTQENSITEGQFFVSIVRLLVFWTLIYRQRSGGGSDLVIQQFHMVDRSQFISVQYSTVQYSTVSNLSLQRISSKPQSTLDKSSSQYNLFWLSHLRPRGFKPSTTLLGNKDCNHLAVNLGKSSVGSYPWYLSAWNLCHHGNFPQVCGSHTVAVLFGLFPEGKYKTDSNQSLQRVSTSPLSRQHNLFGYPTWDSGDSNRQPWCWEVMLAIGFIQSSSWCCWHIL